jgi:succinyl-diaminopimelate desuccinylase
MTTLGMDCTELLRALVERRSITPDDAGCQSLIGRRLASAGFHCESLPFGPVCNLWARFGDQSPTLCFAGHTDVVTPGDVTAWRHDPFAATIEDRVMFGRGTADMKSGLAAMIIAAERFVRKSPSFGGSIAFLVTSDEEGDAVDGTRRVIETLSARGESIDWCIVGEPSSHRRLGDQVRIGRRGSLHGTVHVTGVQGHVAYADPRDNPIARFAPALAELNETQWDLGNEYFPPTGFHVVELSSGLGAHNVTPDSLEARFNFRYSTESTASSLKARVEDIFSRHGLDYSIDWHLHGEPFMTRNGDLVDAVCDAVEDETRLRPKLSTGGGTSDGRFIAPTGAAVVELGPVNASIHKVNEHVALDDLPSLVNIYEGVLERLFAVT